MIECWKQALVVFQPDYQHSIDLYVSSAFNYKEIIVTFNLVAHDTLGVRHELRTPSDQRLSTSPIALLNVLLSPLLTGKLCGRSVVDCLQMWLNTNLEVVPCPHLRVYRIQSRG